MFAILFQGDGVEKIIRTLFLCLVIFGGVACASTWIYGSVSNLEYLAEDGCLPKSFEHRDLSTAKKSYVGTGRNCYSFVQCIFSFTFGEQRLLDFYSNLRAIVSSDVHHAFIGGLEVKKNEEFKLSLLFENTTENLFLERCRNFRVFQYIFGWIRSARRSSLPWSRGSLAQVILVLGNFSFLFGSIAIKNEIDSQQEKNSFQGYNDTENVKSEDKK